MDRPIIEIKLEPFDKLIEIIGFIGLIVLILLPICYYSTLPDTIPRHFTSNGAADAYSGKGIIWTLPIIGLVLYIGLFLLNRYPHLFNYPQKITLKNAERQYKIGSRLIRFLNAVISCVFSYITFSTIQIALGNHSDLGYWFVPIFLVVIFGSIAWYLYNSMKNKNS